ncbi:hypothetical protein TIFTF001_013203 [Ficus carica]|uniref:Uncharacterized protein n=1 Tax=Ficus carica TaxID=3494 RepID=A0AA88A1I2_FICCA|nr:hypothetical protein TIFTF001_013203 [Ficus carica]
MVMGLTVYPSRVIHAMNLALERHDCKGSRPTTSGKGVTRIVMGLMFMEGPD